MMRSLCRGFSGYSMRFSSGNGVGDSGLKSISEIGFRRELLSSFGTCKSRRSFTLCLLKLGIGGIIFLALFCSLFWIVRISTSSEFIIHGGFQQLQEQLVADLSVIEELSLGISKFKELEFCPNEYENHVPCYCITSAELNNSIEYERQCVPSPANERGCLVLPPRDYKVPLRWPSGRDFIWKYNVKITGKEFSSGSLTKRMMVEEEHLSFHSDSLMVEDVEDYSHQIAEMIGLRNESNFNEAGVRTVLDIGCGFGSLGAHLFAKHLLTMGIAKYEDSGSQVQLTLERGLPAMIGSFSLKQLPYPNLAFDMVHCAKCSIQWEKDGGIFLIEVDRLLRPGGYFILTSIENTPRSHRNTKIQRKYVSIRNFAQNICWDMISQQDETIVWKKTGENECYTSRKGIPPACDQIHHNKSHYHHPLEPCILSAKTQRWNAVKHRRHWPSQAFLTSDELTIHGVNHDEYAEDSLNWEKSVQNYWSLLSPLIFSDHPKRPGDEDPSPPFNMLRNVLDMNARFGGFNAALLDAGKSVWVMNVAPANRDSNLPLIFDRGFIGVQHDWCEAFPTYPRTYDMVHAQGLLSIYEHRKCSVLDLFLEIDRILRPEGWVIIRDAQPLIEAIRRIIVQLKWDARLIDQSSLSKDEKLLVCQKPFFKKQIQ